MHEKYLDPQNIKNLPTKCFHAFEFLQFPRKKKYPHFPIRLEKEKKTRIHDY